MDNRSLADAVRAIYEEGRNILGQIDTCEADQVHVLGDILALISRQHQQNASSLKWMSDEQWNEARQIFQQQYYPGLLDFLVSQMSVDFVSSIHRGKHANFMNVVFLESDLCESLLILGDTISKNGPGYKLNKIVSLLEMFLHGHKLRQVLLLQSAFYQGPVPLAVKHQQNLLVTIISTLPERITAKLKQETSGIFYPDVYIPFITKEIFETLKLLHKDISENKNCSLDFLCNLLGKLCITGHGEALWKALLPEIGLLVESNFTWSRVCENWISKVPDRCMDSVITTLILACPGPCVLSRFLGHAVKINHKLNFLLTNKLLLVKFYKKDKVLQNIIGYLTHSTTLRPQFHKVILKLLTVWGDGSALRHTSHEQHVYISKAILVCVSRMDDITVEELRHDLFQLLMKGVHCHLESSLTTVRVLGMVVAESITDRLGAEHKLKFEYEETKEVMEWKSLLTPPQQDTLNSGSPNLTPKVLRPAPTSNITTPQQEDLDSDDDLQPYDMPDNVAVDKKTPVYLRQCMEGLITREDPDTVEGCLLGASKLIRKHPVEVKEIAVEFAKILLHLEDPAGIAGFMGLRHQTLVSLLQTTPEHVSQYLTHQFYERNYNIRQRLDILEALTSAAQELSSPTSLSQTDQKTSPHDSASKATTTPPGDHNDGFMPHWKDVVQRRIDSKTRYFGRGASRQAPAAVANKFAPVAGAFFFPLIRFFDKHQASLDLLGEDHVVLSRLLYTLGVIIYSALHAPVVRQMSAAMLQVIWVLRYHTQQGVRRALAFTVCMVFLATPAHVLMSHLQQDVTETQSWLQDVASSDPNTECQQLAAQALTILANILKQEMENG